MSCAWATNYTKMQTFPNIQINSVLIVFLSLASDAYLGRFGLFFFRETTELTSNRPSFTEYLAERNVTPEPQKWTKLLLTEMKNLYSNHLMPRFLSCSKLDFSCAIRESSHLLLLSEPAFLADLFFLFGFVYCSIFLNVIEQNGVTWENTIATAIFKIEAHSETIICTTLTFSIQGIA